MPPPRILIVEDEVIVAKDVQIRLLRLGYEVAGVTALGEEAVSLAGDLRPDLILMDIRLKGGMDGVAAAQQIHDRWRVPVVYLTAYADDETLHRARVTEPFGYILKPFEERELRTVIEMALYKHEAECRLRDSERRYAVTLSSIGDAVVATDREGRVTFINSVAEALTGWPAREAHGRILNEVFRPADEAAQTPVPGMARRTVLTARGGRQVPIEDCIAPIRDDNGESTGTVLVFRDVTERQRTEEIRARFIEMVISAQEEERRRISRELHDGLGQSLTSVLPRLRLVEEASGGRAVQKSIAEIQGIVAGAVEEMRFLARALRPAVLDELGLVAALERYAADCNRAHGLAVDLFAAGVEGVRLPREVETTLYRIAQEALTNVVKHASARAVTIMIQREAKAVQMIVEDDGRGFDAAALAAMPEVENRLGLIGMRERAVLLNGTVAIESEPGVGTTVCVRLPLPEDPHVQDQSVHHG